MAVESETKLMIGLGGLGRTDEHEQVEALIEAGELPFETFFRLKAIPSGMSDPFSQEDYPHRLVYAILKDLAAYDGDPEAMRPDTQKLIWGEMPKGIVDWDQTYNYKAYAQLDPMYYRMANMARIIKERRAEQGKTVREVPRGWWLTPEEQEERYCFGLTRPIWRRLVERAIPDCIENPRPYYRQTWAFTQAYEAGARTMQRRNVAHAVICDSVVLEFYNEALATGVKGVGPAGRQTLRTLLADEHPELH